MPAPKLVIFDLDNTLYREPPTLNEACEVAMARAVADIIGVPYEEALRMARDSNAKTGSVAHTFFSLYKELDHKTLHDRYHGYIDHMILPRCETTRAAFEKIDQGQTALAVLTHSSRGWASRVLEHLGLAGVFDPDLIVPFEEPGFLFKHESETPFRHVVEKAQRHTGRDFSSADVMVVEDIEKNLEIPCKIGMQTALVLHGRQRGEWLHVHGQFDAVTDVIENFIAKNP